MKEFCCQSRDFLYQNDLYAGLLVQEHEESELSTQERLLTNLFKGGPLELITCHTLFHQDNDVLRTRVRNRRAETDLRI